MSTRHVSAAATRVALAATAIVAAVSLIIGVALFVIVTHNLTSQIDTRLTSALDRIAGENGEPDFGRGFGFGPPPGERLFSDPLLVWTVVPGGQVYSNVTNAHLPPSALYATGPQDITVNNVPLRIEGRQIGDLHVVIGQSTDAVSSAQGQLLTAEVIVLPLLLIAVFAGAVTIGRRVAAPIERARQRQVDFTADASHELRTPLAVIEAQASLAAASEHDVAWYEKAMERIDGESKRMRHLVDDMLWLARFDAAASSPHGEPVDLSVLAAAAVDRFTGVAETRHITLETALTAATPIVSAPPEWLDRLLGVLLDNACRYAPESGRVLVSVADDADRLRLSVEDSGPGIPPGERTAVFDRFRRATDVAGGAGLGLAIADAIVHATAGRWEIGDSDLGGAAMSVTWPRAGISRATGVPAAHPTPGAA